MNPGGEAGIATQRVDADHSQAQADKRHQKSPQTRTAAELREREQAEGEQSDILGGAELQGEAGDLRRDQHEREYGDRAGDERPGHRVVKKPDPSRFLRANVNGKNWGWVG